MFIRYANADDLELINNHDVHVSKSELEKIIYLNRILLAENDGNFVGWLRYGLFWDSIPFMNMLYILERSRGDGIGKHLAKVWEQEMKQMGYTLVMTSTASDEFAQHFYKKLGYKAIGGFSLNNDPYEIIMAKEI